VGVRRVLVVEDNEPQRAMICMILANAGYGIIEAVSVRTALMHLDVIDLHAVVLDIWLPNGHGRKVVEELIAKRDDVPVVVMTGSPEDAPKDFPVMKVLPKPFLREPLLKAVKEATELSDALKSIRTTARKIRDRESSKTIRRVDLGPQGQKG
jgi:DNA-binding NtrC family response regulator